MWNIIWVAISFCRHRIVPVPCKNGSAETTVAEGGRNLVAGLWSRTLGENWPPEPTSSYVSIDVDVSWQQVQPQWLPGCQSQQWWVKDIRLDWPTVMYDDFLHQLVSGSLLSQGWLFNVGEHWKPWRGVERRVAYVDIVLLANDECVIVYFRLRLIDMHFRHVR